LSFAGDFGVPVGSGQSLSNRPFADVHMLQRVKGRARPGFAVGISASRLARAGT
jgi:hypothetical protein